ncbi:GMC oxidoreductase [Ulvibacterium marinum]|uniref:GMC family oxidoreductase n=1 Tax=Ulvibacterium marinum TaxID=2419782 RepID=A0A3B0BYQ9_9FLAO|nr:GMC family oxidoreductase [Ulvibacterium marinum]RKN77960.1 GMC family oxidoreductase [Ulvibacterium marinum]
MIHINTKFRGEVTYDAIVVGTGVSGGWAAKELCEGGLRTLVLERGRNVRHIQDYPTMNDDQWDMECKGNLTQEELKSKPKQSRSGAGRRKETAHFFVNDLENPYNEDKPFDWIRGYQVGGRSLIWGRKCFRLSDLDFEANKRDGHGVDWPIRYKDIAPWYSYVEKHAGIAGNRDGIPHLPDGEFMPPFELNCVEQHAKERIEATFPDRYLITTRTANITEPKDHRGKCMSRHRCDRGCPFGASFSSQSATLPYAEATGNMTFRPNSIVSQVLYDADLKRAIGVRVIDTETKDQIDYYARIIFLNASAMASAAILLNSRSDRFPDGMGNDSGELGHNVMDHAMGAGAGGTMEGFEDKYYKGRKPGGFYVPRFRNTNKNTVTDKFIRGYGYQGGAKRSGWQRGQNDFGFGGDFKDNLLEPGPWGIGMGGFVECLPYHENRMYLNYDMLDKWDQPTITFDAEFKENEKKMCEDAAVMAAEMLEAVGAKNVGSNCKITNIGLGIHEMGTARMGRDPKTSVLNAFNQIHAVPNVFLTDGACMTSSACQNPSLTYMALTARAASYAIKQFRNRIL